MKEEADHYIMYSIYFRHIQNGNKYHNISIPYLYLQIDALVGKNFEFLERWMQAISIFNFVIN